MMPQVNEQFAKMDTTVGQSITKLNTSFSKLIGDTDDATSASAKLAGKISELADIVASPEFISSFNHFVDYILVEWKLRMDG